MAENKLPRIIIMSLLTLVVATMFVTCLTGCGSSKKATTTSTTKTDSIFIHDTSTVIKSDTVRVTKVEEKIKEVTSVKFDTIQKECPKNKIVYKFNGDVELEGNIKEYNRENTVERSRYDSLRVHHEEEKRARLFWQKTAEENKTTKQVKRGISPVVWMLFGSGLLIAFLLGIYIGVKFHLKLKK